MGRSGGLDLTSCSEAKFGARSDQFHQMRGKTWEVLSPTRRKSWEKVPILGSYLKFRGQNLGYLSLIFLEAKFAAPIRISEANFGAKPPRPPSMEVPPWDFLDKGSYSNTIVRLKPKVIKPTFWTEVITEVCFHSKPDHQDKGNVQRAPFLGLSSVLNKISQKTLPSTVGHLKTARILECCELCPPSAIAKAN